MENNKQPLQASARYLAVEALEKVFVSGAYSNLQLNRMIEQHKLSNQDSRLLTNIVYGVIQHRLTLEYWLAPFVANKKMDPWVQTLLLSAIYQRQYLDKIPDWAILNESIEIAKVRGHVGIRKFVTAILHQILRTKLGDFSEIKDPQKRLSIEYSIPLWLVETLIEQYGQISAETIIHSLNHPANQSVRVNSKLTTVDEMLVELGDAGLTVHKSEVTPNALTVEKGMIADLSQFQTGKITLQDESAMLAVESMDLQPAFKVLDACAAPGGKTVQIASYLRQGEGTVTALDIHTHKMKLIQQNARRMQVDQLVDPELLDARKVDEKFADDSFDAILVDAPCSGLGLMRRKPEIRYEKKLADSLSLQKIQLSILDSVAQKVKKGGIITYSTCTILKQENDDVVTKFLANHPDFSLLTTKTKNNLKQERTTKTLTILPSDYNSDGFFVSNLKRNV
ncbi:16S rRNA methyltransferase [Paucilactobacillus hokkaidonensis JCM 18461]|uniref:16S rRNA (cytosine(967)-C(5))-methyltransferase n=2 Tax=Paucilactobacillus hokkaidonensis TaxID=1193095 RepID=A0A0A1GYK4_9LACO|nr:16S rRNA (cytosine(967)-C(5))-methyltransferase RsmB [Paucilactobacillus hokkaidonensis]KRO09763.1 16S rRNA methyltransferase B [Paucilactobacillus hokkaidonensis]BAP85571.1 16S rRNA methyltransferase [Paucilactobacillus hokkaidonensis JCM 18461]